MTRIGICFKCGETKNVIRHHPSYAEDVVKDCCLSCHKKIHIRIRREGRCPFSVEEVDKKSTRSSQRRTCKIKTISCKTVLPNVQLFEMLKINFDTGVIYINSYFSANHSKELKFIDI